MDKPLKRRHFCAQGTSVSEKFEAILNEKASAATLSVLGREPMTHARWNGRLHCSRSFSRIFICQVRSPHMPEMAQSSRFVRQARATFGHWAVAEKQTFLALI